jgi:hypothetical protein
VDVHAAEEARLQGAQQRPAAAQCHRP